MKKYDEMCFFCKEPAYEEWHQNNEPICRDCFQGFTGHDPALIDSELALEMERHEHQQSAWGGNDPHG